MIPKNDVGHTRRNAAVHHGSDSLFLRHVVQTKRILREVGDVHNVLSCTNNPFEHFVSYGVRHRTDNNIRVFNGASDSFPRGEVLYSDLDGIITGQVLQGFPVDVHRDDLEVGILTYSVGHVSADGPTAQHYNSTHILLPIFLTDELREALRLPPRLHSVFAQDRHPE